MPDGFAEACARRAREAHVGSGRGGWVAGNGAVLEQSQILTTHNLAVLVEGLDRRVAVAALARELVATVLDGLVRGLRRPAPSRHAELIAVKNAAYAWRQAIFLLSFAGRDVQDSMIGWLRAQPGTPGLPPAFGEVVAGLEHAVGGGTFGPDGKVPGGAPGRRFLGWSVGPHWLQRHP